MTATDHTAAEPSDATPAGSADRAGSVSTRMVVLVYGLGGLIIGVVLGIVAVGFAGGGHGSPVVPILLFPYAMIVARFTDAIEWPMLAAALAQYPAYAIAIELSIRRNRGPVAGVALMLLHVCAVIAAAVLHVLYLMS